MNGFFFSFWAVVLLMVTTGCSLHSVKTPDPGQLPEFFVELPTGNQQAMPIGRWWKDFKDPILDRLINEALANNLDIARAYGRMKQLEATARSSDAARLPFVNFEGQGSRDKQPSFVGTTTSNNYRLALAAGYEIDLWQKLQAKSNAAGLDALASREDIKTLYLSLTAQLADFYYVAVEQRAQIALLDIIIDSFAETLQRVEQRYYEGQANALAVYLSRQSLAVAKARRPVFEANLAAAQHAVAVLLGRFPEHDIAGNLAILPQAPDAYPAGIPSELITMRPDIRAAALRVRARDENVGAAIAERFPSFNLLADYGRTRISFGSPVTDTFWNLIVNTALPIVDGGRRRAEVDRNQALLKQELARYRQTVLQAFQDVEDALAQNRTSEQRVALLEEQLAHSKASARLAADNYFQGLDGYLPVLTAQRLQLEAETQLINAKRQLISDRISLIRALGGEWMNKMMAGREQEAANRSNNDLNP